MSDSLNDQQLREALQRTLSKLVDRGASPESVAEQAFTVATANLATVHGPRRAAASLATTAVGLTHLADQAGRDDAAKRH